MAAAAKTKPIVYLQLFKQMMAGSLSPYMIHAAYSRVNMMRLLQISLYSINRKPILSGFS